MSGKTFLDDLVLSRFKKYITKIRWQQFLEDDVKPHENIQYKCCDARNDAMKNCSW